MKDQRYVCAICGERRVCTLDAKHRAEERAQDMGRNYEHVCRVCYSSALEMQNAIDAAEDNQFCDYAY